VNETLPRSDEAPLCCGGRNLAYANPFRVAYKAAEKGKNIVNPKLLNTCFPEGA